MKLFKKKDKNIEAEETLAKNAESAKTAADGKNAGAAQEAKEDVPETIVCPKCGKTVLKSVVKQHKYVCYECNYYFRVRAKNRIRMVSDKEAFEPWFTELTTGNPLNFPEYEEKIAKTQEKTGLSEGIVIGKTKIYGEETVLGVIDSRHFADADGKDLSRSKASFRFRTFICACTHRSYNRRCDSQLCNAWRHHSCRAKGTYRFCGSSCYRADHRTEAA